MSVTPQPLSGLSIPTFIQSGSSTSSSLSNTASDFSQPLSQAPTTAPALSSPTASASDTDWDSDILDSNPGSHEILLISFASVLGAAVVAVTLLLGVREWRRRRNSGAYRGAPMSWGGVASYAFLGERKGKARVTSGTDQSSEEDTNLYHGCRAQ